MITRDQRVIRLNHTGAACATIWQQGCGEPVAEAVHALTRRYPHMAPAHVEHDVRHFLTVLQQAGALPTGQGASA